MSSRDEHDKAPNRLRVPAALAVAFVGSSAMVSIWYGGCDPNAPDPVLDAGRIEAQSDDAQGIDAGADETPIDAMIDAMPDPPADVPVDAAPPGDPPPDANEPPH